MSATIHGTLVTSEYSFMLTYDDVSHLSLSLPSSYGFTIQKVYINDADITDRFTDTSSLWLSVGDTGKGLYTVTMSYYQPQ